MKTGLEQITSERKEQLKKGKTIDFDVQNNTQGQLIIAAQALLQTSVGRYMNAPTGWNPEYWDKLLSKPFNERLAIAGAFIAAEIDRNNNLDKIVN